MFSWFGFLSDVLSGLGDLLTSNIEERIANLKTFDVKEKIWHKDLHKIIEISILFSHH